MTNAASASFSPLELSAVPGGTTVGEVRIRNEGAEEHRFNLEVVGDSRQWVSISPSALTIGPGLEGEARLFVRPPRSPSVPAGRHEVSVRIRSDLDPRTQVVAGATVDVEPFHELSASLGSTGSEAWSVTVDNRGNVPARAALSASDGAGDVLVTIEPAVLELAPGARAEAQVGVKARRTMRAGDHPLRIVVESEGEAPIALEGTVRRSRRLNRGALLSVGAVVVAVALIAALLGTTVFSSAGESSRRPATATTTGASAGGAPPDCPGYAHLAHDANGQIRAKVLEPPNYAFLFENASGCLPVRWNPCEPIHYVFNPEFARPADLADARQAIADLALATGLQFTYDGTTAVNPRQYEPYQPSVYGPRWAPLLIHWGHLGSGNGLTEVAGGGFPDLVDGVYVSGIVEINVDAVLPGGTPVPNGFGSGVTFGRLLLHELGHAVGLGHVTSFDEVMHDPVTDQTSPTSAYGFGDAIGLKLLGRGAGCLTTPPARAVANRGVTDTTASPAEPAHGMPTSPTTGP